MHRQLVYINLMNVPSFSSRYFNKIKRASRLGRLLALPLEILSPTEFGWIVKDGRYGMNLFAGEQLPDHIESAIVEITDDAD